MKIRRKFNLKDAQFIEHSEVLAATLPGDLPAFTAFDSTIDSVYLTGLQQNILDVKAIPPDEVVVDEQAEHTLLVNQALNACNEDYKTVAYFVRKAFKSNPAIRNQFGLNDITGARKNQAEMVLFMESLAKTATKYSAQLIEAGCSESLITGLEARAATLHDANIAQEKFKDDRSLKTQTRVETLNKLYERLRPVYDSAVFIFADNPQKLRIYTLPKPSKPLDEETPEQE